MFNDFLSALSFLTILPVKEREINRNTLFYFPIVGLFIGIFLVLVNFFSTKLFPSSITNLFILLFLTLITGGLHLDGFADTFDGFFSSKNCNEILSIMDDPHIGTKGVTAVFFLLFFKFFILEKIKFKYPLLILMPTISRSAMVLTILLTQPAKNQGLGKVFSEQKNYSAGLFVSLFTLCLVVFFLQLKGIPLIFLVVFLIYLLIKYSNKKIGGITGDILGALNEIVELCILFFFLF